MIPKTIEMSLESLIRLLDAYKIEVCVIDHIDMPYASELVLQKGGTILAVRRYGDEFLFAYANEPVMRGDYYQIKWLIRKVETICIQVTKKYDDEIGRLFEKKRNQVMNDLRKK
jgi:hypothetical protein